MLDLLVWHKLTGGSGKATIAVSEVVFTGHVVWNGQRKPIPGKVAAIEHWEKLKTVSELRAYLGFCNYYSGYIKLYAEYAAPMTTMLKGNREETKKGSKKALVWNDDSDRAFEGMKQALLSAVGLHLVDPDRGFVLRTDASDYVIGAVLEQVLDDGNHVPVAFWSRVLAEGQRRTWTPRQKEAYAIVMALRKWAGYIALHHVTVCTDHQRFEVSGLILRVLDAFWPRGATWSGQVISSPPGPSRGPSKTHLLPGRGVPRVHRARSPVLPRLPRFATPRSVHQFVAVAAGAYPLRRPPNAWSPGALAPPGPCYWLVASGTPLGWRRGCLA